MLAQNDRFVAPHPTIDEVSFVKIWFITVVEPTRRRIMAFWGAGETIAVRAERAVPVGVAKQRWEALNGILFGVRSQASIIHVLPMKLPAPDYSRKPVALESAPKIDAALLERD